MLWRTRSIYRAATQMCEFAILRATGISPHNLGCFAKFACSYGIEGAFDGGYEGTTTMSITDTGTNPWQQVS